jgi:threonine dehydratase
MVAKTSFEAGSAGRDLFTLTDVREANSRIQRYIHRTPVMHSSSINDLAGARLAFKCENFQRAGSFKARGAFNAVFSLTETEAAHGVVTSSSGNQAAGLALAGRTRNIPVYVAMPKIALRSKVAAVYQYIHK